MHPAGTQPSERGLTREKRLDNPISGATMTPPRSIEGKRKQGGPFIFPEILPPEALGGSGPARGGSQRRGGWARDRSTSPVPPQGAVHA